MKKILALILATLMIFTLCACSVPAVQVQNEDGTQTVWGVLIEQTVNTVAKACMVAVLLFGTWATEKLGKNLKLKNLSLAVQKVCELTRQTVGELQQTIVETLKAQNPDGKLTPEQIDDLGFRLLNLVKLKLDDATKELIIASGADLDALITGECEAFLSAQKGTLLIGDVIHGAIGEIRTDEPPEPSGKAQEPDE